MREQHRVHHHLVIQEIVPRADHGAAVQDHQITEGLGLVDLQLLVGSLFLMQFAFDFQGKSGAYILNQLAEPAVIFCHLNS
jgi:hypothetical protein